MVIKGYGKEEFNLSSKILTGRFCPECNSTFDGEKLFYRKDVKEFIRLIKLEVEECDVEGRGMCSTSCFIREIDKLAGDELNGK